jgi:hypothetical protein
VRTTLSAAFTPPEVDIHIRAERDWPGACADSVIRPSAKPTPATNKALAGEMKLRPPARLATSHRRTRCVLDASLTAYLLVRSGLMVMIVFAACLGM